MHECPRCCESCNCDGEDDQLDEGDVIQCSHACQSDEDAADSEDDDVGGQDY